MLHLNDCHLGSFKHAFSVNGGDVEGSSRYRHWLEETEENREMKPIQVSRSLGQEVKQKSHTYAASAKHYTMALQAVLSLHHDSPSSVVTTHSDFSLTSRGTLLQGLT